MTTTSKRVTTLPPNLRVDHDLSDGIYVRDRYASNVRTMCTTNQDENTYPIGECGGENSPPTSLPSKAYINDQTGDVYFQVGTNDYLQVNRPWGRKREISYGWFRREIVTEKLTLASKEAEELALILGREIPADADLDTLEEMARAATYYLKTESLYLDRALNISDQLIRNPCLDYKTRTELVASMHYGLRQREGKSYKERDTRLVEFAHAMILEPMADATAWVSMEQSIPNLSVNEALGLQWNVGLPASAWLYVTRPDKNFFLGIAEAIAANRGIDAGTRLSAILSSRTDTNQRINLYLDIANDSHVPPLDRLKSIQSAWGEYYYAGDLRTTEMENRLKGALYALLSTPSLTGKEASAIAFYACNRIDEKLSDAGKSTLMRTFLEQPVEDVETRLGLAYQYERCADDRRESDPFLRAILQGRGLTAGQQLNILEKLMNGSYSEDLEIWTQMAYIAENRKEPRIHIPAAILCFRHAKNEEEKNRMLAVLEKTAASDPEILYTYGGPWVLFEYTKSMHIRETMARIFLDRGQTVDGLVTVIYKYDLSDTEKQYFAEVVAKANKMLIAGREEQRIRERNASPASVPQEKPNYNLAVVID